MQIRARTVYARVDAEYVTLPSHKSARPLDRAGDTAARCQMNAGDIYYRGVSGRKREREILRKHLRGYVNSARAVSRSAAKKAPDGR